MLGHKMLADSGMAPIGQCACDEAVPVGKVLDAPFGFQYGADAVSGDAARDPATLPNCGTLAEVAEDASSAVGGAAAGAAVYASYLPHMACDAVSAAGDYASQVCFIAEDFLAGSKFWDMNGDQIQLMCGMTADAVALSAKMCNGLGKAYNRFGSALEMQ